MNVHREDHVEADGSSVLLVVDGTIDMHTSPDLRRHLRQALDRRGSPIVVDLTAVPFVDSSGLATLIEALQGVNRYGGKLRLVGLQPGVRNVFRLSNLTSIFTICDTREEGLRP